MVSHIKINKLDQKGQIGQCQGARTQSTRQKGQLLGAAEHQTHAEKLGG